MENLPKPYGQRKKRKPIYDASTGVPPTPDQEEAMRKQAKNVVNWWLDQFEKSRKELYDKIKNKGITDEIANEILDEYEERGYIDDFRYAENFIYSKTTYDKLGKQAIKYKLMQKGVPTSIIDKALEGIEEESLEENARRLVESKIRTTTKYEPYKRVQNIASHLMRKGYSSSLSYRLAKEAVQQATQENLDIVEE